jgi:hypothetical protein
MINVFTILKCDYSMKVPPRRREKKSSQRDMKTE